MLQTLSEHTLSTGSYFIETTRFVGCEPLKEQENNVLCKRQDTEHVHIQIIHVCIQIYNRVFPDQVPCLWNEFRHMV